MPHTIPESRVIASLIVAVHPGRHTLGPTFPDLRIALGEVFDFPLEPGEEPPKMVGEPLPHYTA
jgi:hypothetical protein